MAVKILLVDDMAFVKFLEKSFLEEAGYTFVGEASDGEEAIE